MRGADELSESREFVEQVHMKHHHGVEESHRALAEQRDGESLEAHEDTEHETAEHCVHESEVNSYEPRYELQWLYTKRRRSQALQI